MLKITSLSWQTLGLLMILHKHSVPWESGLPNAKMMERLDGADEISAGAEESAVEVRGLVEQIEDAVGALPQLPLTNVTHVI